MARRENEPFRVLIAGLGRSGWNIHASTIRRHPHRFRIVGVCDLDAHHREQAARELDCPIFDDFDAMLSSAEADVVAICTPNHLHAAHTFAAIDAGLHVIAEKPFALGLADADRMIAAAQAAGVILAPFHNRRFESHFRKVQSLCESGLFGEILQIRMCWHTFSRRWDWQALRKFGGGALQNNGAHLLDQALQLFGPSDPEIFCDLRRGLSEGDADQHMKVVLHGEGAPTIDVELTNASAFEQERWHIMGTAGGLRGTVEELHWRWVDWSDMPARPIDAGPAEARRYPSEDIPWQEGHWRVEAEETKQRPYDLFYENVHAALLGEEPLVVTPESARRYVAIVEERSHVLQSIVD